MADPYIGEIRLFASNFAPVGWAFCQGQQLQISEYESLFNLIGTTYGGDGQATFGLPDLNGRVPVHQGQGPGISQNYTIGEMAGVETVTLTPQQTPVHNHAWNTSTAGGSASSPQGNILASPPVAKLYRAGSPGDQFPNVPIQPAGGSLPHDNMMPFIAVYYIISLFGIYPSQT